MLLTKEGYFRLALFWSSYFLAMVISLIIGLEATWWSVFIPLLVVLFDSWVTVIAVQGLDDQE